MGLNMMVLVFLLVVSSDIIDPLNYGDATTWGCNQY
jgi:hypothetical protein